jgi:hypothetical protein
MGKWEPLHNETFVGIGTRSVGERFVGLRPAERTASGLNLGGIRKTRAHLSDEIFKTRTDVPISLGGGFVEGDAPFDSVTTDQLLGHLAFCGKIQFCPHNDNRYRLMEGRSGDKVMSQAVGEYGLLLPGCHLLGDISVAVDLQSPVDWSLE